MLLDGTAAGMCDPWGALSGVFADRFGRSFCGRRVGGLYSVLGEQSDWAQAVGTNCVLAPPTESGRISQKNRCFAFFESLPSEAISRYLLSTGSFLNDARYFAVVLIF